MDTFSSSTSRPDDMQPDLRPARPTSSPHADAPPEAAPEPVAQARECAEGQGHPGGFAARLAVLRSHGTPAPAGGDQA